MLILQNTCLLCFWALGVTLRTQEFVRHSGAKTPTAEDWLEDTLSANAIRKVGAHAPETVYLKSLLHLSKYLQTAGQKTPVKLADWRGSHRAEQDWPQIIHQTAKDPSHLSPLFSASSESWKSLYPTWDYRLWGDDDIETFMRTHYPSFNETWQLYPANIMRVDAVRYFWLHHFGGIYADLDYFALRDVGPLLEEYADSEVILGQLGQGIDPWTGTNNSIPNALMISKPNATFMNIIIDKMPVYLHKFCFHSEESDLLTDKVKEMMAQPEVVHLEESIMHHADSLRRDLGFELHLDCKDLRPEAVTGPFFLTNETNFFDTYGMVVAEPQTFYPIDWSTEIGQRMRREFSRVTPRAIAGYMRRIFPSAFGGTTWSHTWE